MNKTEEIEKYFTNHYPFMKVDILKEELGNCDKYFIILNNAVKFSLTYYHAGVWEGCILLYSGNESLWTLCWNSKIYQQDTFQEAIEQMIENLQKVSTTENLRNSLNTLENIENS